MSNNEFNHLSDKEKINHLKSIKEENTRNIKKKKAEIAKKRFDRRKISYSSLPIHAPKKESSIDESNSQILATSGKLREDNLNSSESINKVQDNEHQVKYVSEESLVSNEKIILSKWLVKNPSRAIIFSFATLIIIGAILLSLPIANQSGQWTNFLTALFTSTSATCVTGLILVDTGLYWSIFGQLVIISLIQVGGVGLITIIASFISTSKKKIGIATIRVIQDTLGSDSVEDVYDLLKKVVKYTISFELIGGLILAAVYLKYMPAPYAIYAGLFQGVSAFCNAGFDILSPYFGSYGSLTALNNEPLVLIVSSFLLTFGGLGFIVWRNIFDAIKGRKKLSFHSKLVIRITIFILLVGTIIYLLLEWNNTSSQSLGTLPVSQRPLAAFFQVATLRTAGFNTISQSNLRDASLLIACIIMFMGASPLSTGGGVKITTIALVTGYVTSRSRGEERVVIRKRAINRSTTTRAFVIFVIFLVVALFSTCILAIVEQEGINSEKFTTLDLLFEVLSALCTVGVTSIQTNNLGLISRIILMACMFIGRVGPFSIALFLSERAQANTSSNNKEVLQEVSTYVG